MISNLQQSKSVHSDVIDSKFTTSAGLNSCNLYCPRCSCLILKASVARLDTQSSFEIPSIRKDESDKIPPFTWVLTDMMLFENIGFTNPLPNESQIKRYLSCAECDLGTL